MSIDGRIRDVTRDGTDVLLALEPRYDARVGHFQGPGQKYLRIMEGDWIPSPGMIVWGNSGEIVIGSGLDEHRYERVTMTRLRQKLTSIPHPDGAPGGAA